MLKAQVIGVGAAGNKASVELVKANIVPIQNVMLVNSTVRDIPKEFIEKQGKVSQIGTNELNGCGKEREEGKKLALAALQSGKLDLDTFINPDTDIVIIATSTEGGTGSGASVIIAQYLKSVLDVNVHIFAFTGFEEDTRGLFNTVEFFKDIKEDYTVQIVRNKKFTQETNNNLPKAEDLANKEFAIRTDILLGNPIKPSDQNIDNTDLYKISTNTGYMDIQYREISEKIRNTAQFNDIIQEMIDDSKGMDIDTASQTLMGVIININENEKGSIDHDFNGIIDHYGFPFEKFKHIQSDKGMKTFIAFICTGMKIPVQEIQDVYDKYRENTVRVNKGRDEFLSTLNKFTGEEADSMFNLASRKAATVDKTKENRKDFFTSFDLQAPNLPKDNNSNKSVHTKPKKGEDMKEY